MTARKTCRRCPTTSANPSSDREHPAAIHRQDRQAKPVRPAKSSTAKDLTFKGGSPRLHAANHRLDKAKDMKSKLPGSAEKPVQPLRELPACLPRQGNLPLALRRGRPALPGHGHRHHRPAGECQADLRPRHPADHQPQGRQRTARRRRRPARTGSSFTNSNPPTAAGPRVS